MYTALTLGVQDTKHRSRKRHSSPIASCFIVDFESVKLTSKLSKSLLKELIVVQLLFKNPVDRVVTRL